MIGKARKNAKVFWTLFEYLVTGEIPNHKSD